MTETTATPTPDRGSVCAALVLERALEGPTRLGVFTDEELTALDGLATEQIVPTPWLSAHAEQVSTEIAAGISLRSLIARRLVLPAEQLADDWDDLGEDPRRLYAVDPVQGILTLRRSASALTTLQRIVEDQSHALVHYDFGQGRALEEEITHDGFHHFTILPLVDVPARAMALVDQAEVAQGDGEPRRARMSEVEQDQELAAILGDTRALTVLSSVRRDAEPAQYTFYATSDRLLVSRSEDGLDAADPHLQFVEISAGTAEDLLAEVVGIDPVGDPADDPTGVPSGAPTGDTAADPA